MRTLTTALALLCPLPLAENPPTKTVPVTRTQQILAPITSPVRTQLKARPNHTTTQRGIASWYGRENFVASTGKRLKHKSPALAHRTLPIGTLVKITALKTNRTVLAVVEDRGPYKHNRIADLNYPAAKELGIVKSGLTRVKLEVIN